MGAIMVSQSIAEKLNEAAEQYEEFPRGYTTADHPVGCSIALKAIDIILNRGVLDNISPFPLISRSDLQVSYHIHTSAKPAALD